MKQGDGTEPERFQKLVTLFHELHEKREAERATMLEETRASDPDLAAELERMLKDEQGLENFLENPPLEAFGQDVPEVSLGDTVDHYRILSLLGSGGMGIVYCAEDIRLNRRVALKFLAPHLVGYGQNRERFVKEARAAAALHHPNVCPVYEIGETDGRAYIVMALLEGETLAQRIAGGPIPIREAVALALEVARGLEAAHAKGIVHHDVKPANLMITPGSDGQHHATLMDFGLAQMMDLSRSSGERWLAGTISYMAPERVAGSAADQRTDLWSLGVILFEMVTGQKPFRGANDRVVLNAIANLDPGAPSTLRHGVPKELDRMVAKALAKRPERRYGTAAELNDDLQEIIGTLEGGKGGFREPKRRLRRQGRWMVLLGAVALLMLFSGWFAWEHLSPVRNPILRQLTDQIPDARVTTAAISPDGNLLAYATVDGVFLQVIRTRETHLLRSPPDFWVDRIRWFTDGDKLAIGGFSRTSLQPSIWLVSVVGGAPVLLRTNARDPQPNKEGASIAYTNAERSEIWLSGLSGEEPHRIVTAEGQRLLLLFWTQDDSHLAFTRSSVLPEPDPTSEAVRFGLPPVRGAQTVSEFQSIDVATGQLETYARNLGLTSAALFKGGRVLFLSGDQSHPENGNVLWEMQTDARTGRVTVPPRRMPVRMDWIRDMSVSASGTRATVIRLTSSPTAYVAAYSAHPPTLSNVRRLTLDGSGSFPHSWTADSKAVIFESDRRGNNDLFLQEADSRVAQSIVATPRDDFHANLSPDGRWLLFMQAKTTMLTPAAVMRVPMEGGVPEQVAATGVVDEFRCALPGGKRCVARTTEGKTSYVFYELDPVGGVGRELARTAWLPNMYGDWALSPEGTEVAIPNHDQKSAKIRLLHLDTTEGDRESELSVNGLTNISGLNWTADGKGWFVVVTTTVGRRLVYIDRAGHVTPLLDGASYAIPSPDGKRAALMIPSVSANVWSIEGF